MRSLFRGRMILRGCIWDGGMGRVWDECTNNGEQFVCSGENMR